MRLANSNCHYVIRSGVARMITDKAILFRPQGKLHEVWIPKACLSEATLDEVSDDGQVYDFAVASWFDARENLT